MRPNAAIAALLIAFGPNIHVAKAQQGICNFYGVCGGGSYAPNPSVNVYPPPVNIYPESTNTIIVPVPVPATPAPIPVPDVALVMTLPLDGSGGPLWHCYPFQGSDGGFTCGTSTNENRTCYKNPKIDRFVCKSEWSEQEVLAVKKGELR